MNRSLPILAALSLAAFAGNATAQNFKDNDRNTVVNDSFNTAVKKEETTKIDVDVRKSYEDNDTINKKRVDIEDSYNKTNKTEIEDSYNKTHKTEIEDSYNTTHETEVEIEDSYNKTTKIDVNDHSTHLNNVLNGLSAPVANTDLDARIAYNRVLNLNIAGQQGNIQIRDAFSGARGVNSMNTNTGAHSIQQVGVSISVVQNTSK